MTRLSAILLLVFAVIPVSSIEAATLSYSWSGFIESRFANPFGFAGDGNRNTTGDATPFTLTMNIDSAAFDTSNSTTQAAYNLTDFVLEIDGLDPLTEDEDTIQAARATFSESTFDRITFSGVFNAPVPGGGTSALGFGTGVTLPSSTFSLGGVSRSSPPLFESANLSFAGTGTVNGGTIIIYTSLEAPVVLGPNAIPEPSTLLLALGVAGSLITWRRIR